MTGFLLLIMANATLYVFSSPTCPHCPTAKAIAGQVAKERDDVTYKDVVSGMAGSNKLFKKFDIASVPTIIIQGPEYPQNIGLKGTQPAPTLHKYLDVAVGKREVEESSSSSGGSGFLGKLKRMFSALEE